LLVKQARAREIIVSLARSHVWQIVKETRQIGQPMLSLADTPLSELKESLLSACHEDLAAHLQFNPFHSSILGSIHIWGQWSNYNRAWFIGP
jgi:hypothetical protein